MTEKQKQYRRKTWVDNKENKTRMIAINFLFQAMWKYCNEDAEKYSKQRKTSDLVRKEATHLEYSILKKKPNMDEKTYKLQMHELAMFYSGDQITLRRRVETCRSHYEEKFKQIKVFLDTKAERFRHDPKGRVRAQKVLSDLLQYFAKSTTSPTYKFNTRSVAGMQNRIKAIRKWIVQVQMQHPPSRAAQIEKTQLYAKAKNDKKQCDHCGIICKGSIKLQMCSICRRARYCGKECQTAAWPKHSKTCVDYTKMQSYMKSQNAGSKAKIDPLTRNTSADWSSRATVSLSASQIQARKEKLKKDSKAWLKIAKMLRENPSADFDMLMASNSLSAKSVPPVLPKQQSIASDIEDVKNAPLIINENFLETASWRRKRRNLTITTENTKVKKKKKEPKKKTSKKKKKKISDVKVDAEYVP